MSREITEEEQKAKKALKDAESAGSGNYVSKYADKLKELENTMASRSFSYDASEDPLYKQYADSYVNNGRLAMKDTMGRTAALTGGYGSSYSAAAGQQTYDNYLQALADAGLDIYDRAYSRYSDEGDAIEKEYERYAALDNADYSRYADDRDYRLDELEYLADREQTAYERALAEAEETQSGGSAGSGSSGTKSSNKYSAVLSEVRALSGAGNSASAQKKINAAYAGGYITEAQKKYLSGKYGKSTTSTVSGTVLRPGQIAG